MLLKSLCFFHSNEDVYEKVIQHKSNAKILIKKELFKEASLHISFL